VSSHPFIFGARGGGSGGGPCPPPSQDWVRPTDWIAIPTLTSSDERIYGVLAVFENEYNSIAFTITNGSANVDFGDGSNVNTTGGVQTKVYDYSTLAGAVNVWPDGRNYKQVLVDVTRIGGPIVSVDFRVFSTVARDSTTNFVDMSASLPSCTGFPISVAQGAAAGRTMPLLQRLRVYNLAVGYTAVTNFVRYLYGLRVLELPWNRMGSLGALLATPYHRIDPIGDIVTPASSLQSGLVNLTAVENIVANSATTIQSAFDRGYLSRIISLTATSCTVATNAFANTFLLTGSVNLVLPALQNASIMFAGSSVSEVIFSDCAAVNNTTSIFNLATNIQNVVMPNLTRGVVFNNTPMGNDGMSNFANSLGTASGTQNITVTGTPFGQLLAAADATAVAIAAVITGQGFGIIN